MAAVSPYPQRRTERKENERKLLEDRAEVEALRDSVKATNHVSSNITTTLSDMDRRLGILEHGVVPVHRSTQRLNRVLANLTKSVAAMEKIVHYLDYPAIEEKVIMEPPTEECMTSYLASLDRLQEAMEFWQASKLSRCKERQVTKLRQLRRAGLLEIVSLFRKTLNTWSVSIEIKDLLKQDSKEAPLPPEDVVENWKNLLNIIKQLRDDSPVGDFQSVWSEARARYLQQSLGKASMNMDRKQPKMPRPRSNRNLLVPQGSGSPSSSMSSLKTTRSMEKSLNASNNTAASGNADPEANPLTFTEYCMWMVRFFKSEKVLIKSVFPTGQDWSQAFNDTISPVLDSFLESGQDMLQKVQTTMEKNSYFSADVFVVYEVFENLVTSKKEIESFAEGGTQGAVRTKTEGISDLISQFLGTCVKGCSGFLNDVRSSKNVQDTLASDGTVYALTSDVVNFLRRLLQIPESIDQILTGALSSEKTATNRLVAVDGEPSPSMRVFYTESLNALVVSLEAKASQYKNPPLEGIFMLNNYQYIMRSFEFSRPEVDGAFSFADVVGDEFIETTKKALKKQQDVYQSSLRPLIALLMDVTVIQEGKIRASLSAKEKENIKDKFKAFNEKFEELFRTQSSYVIADPDLRKTVRDDVKKVIVPMYTRFWEKYHNTDFSRNPSKYVRYDKQAVEKMIDRLFEGKDI